jgi:hypothetical protein
MVKPDLRDAEEILDAVSDLIVVAYQIRAKVIGETMDRAHAQADYYLEHGRWKEGRKARPVNPA